MEKVFSIFGKIVLLLAVLGGLGYGAYYLGQKSNPAGLSAQPSPTASQSTLTLTPTTPVSPTPTTVPKKTVNGGVDKSTGLAFSQYSLSIGADWIETKDSPSAAIETLTLTNDEYQIKIFQAATGGAICLYPGDPDSEGPSSKFTIFSQITTKDALVLRRSGDNKVNAGKIGFTLCQKNTEGGYGQPTNYGHISISIPQNYDPKILAEIDTTLSTLAKK